MNSFDYGEYILLISKLKDNFGLTEDVEHKYIHIMKEGTVQLFRIIFGYDPETNANELYLSFHLDINPVDSIMWYQRIKQAYSKVKLLECYFQDQRGETYTGQAAEVIRHYILEQEVISNWKSDDEQTDKYVNAKIIGRNPNENVSFDPKRASEVFNIMVPDDDDTQH